MLYTIKQLRQIEQSALSSLEPGTLMRAAGKAAAQAALQLLKTPNQAVLILVGPGNNGGDALEAAVHLANAGHQIFVLHSPSKTARSPSGQQAFNQAQACTQINWLASDAPLQDNYALVIDGLFGIGLTQLAQQKISPALQKQITQCNAMSCPILALDVPSGLDADTGTIITNIAIQASHTITFIADKAGLHTGDGQDYAGLVEVADLDIALEYFPVSVSELNKPALFPDIAKPRRHNSHKGSNGTVAVIGGAVGMQGAVILAARAALYSGAGRTVASFVEATPNFDAQQPELMCRPAQQVQFNPDTVVVIGPGLGNSIASFDLVSRALLSTSPLIIDADALNLMAQQPALHALCNGRDKLSTLLTPHPLEAARLLGCSVEIIQADRISAAKKLARQYSSVVILKGSGSIIAHPDGNMVINPTGNAGLASGGTGDVLGGVCGALMAQHKNMWQAALAATYLHGTAADSLVALGIGPIGLCASELLVEIRKQLNTLLK
ncbi:NAD(P)H-hydrate dehydratase [Solimicrobium silvestre]|uniref:Bifunctional NAD(P)H-hydrate repair enzyme n=1 Tax=Solimicrobium silvestre TaxID=2099400 RepID=A0A2S9GVA0_9BURK|nr:NAD(P)H-hydrate dehydratase [Solimicrobium silvestre]PRC91655.1 YjeF family C-terminal domain [Solimicrobium silvestre]